MTENDIRKRCMLKASKLGTVLFRNNVGLFWSLDKKRKVRCGLIKGSSDLIGFTSIQITQDMVGKKIAVFTAIETKFNTVASEEQKNFINVVKAAGGYAGLAYHENDLMGILHDN